MPSEMPGHDIYTESIANGTLLIYPVTSLNSTCYGTVTAIEYCYRFTGVDQAMLDWTVFILEDRSNEFMINHLHNIQAHGSLSSANCTSSLTTGVTCCNRTSIENFNLSMNFAFGVTDSQGATLLGVHNGVPQYTVNVVLLNKNNFNLSVGHTIPHTPMVQRGIRMLWFIIGKHA